VSGPVVALNIFVAVVSDAGYAVSCGCLLAIRWLHDAADLFRVLRQILLACVAGLIFAQAARPWFVAASMSGSESFAGNLALIPDVLFSTHQGKVWFIGSLGLAALLATLFFAGRQVRTGVWPFAVSLFLIGCAKAASGHAAGDGDFTLAEFSMLLHIAGTAVWAGTVIASGVIVVPALAKLGDAQTLWSYARFLSRTVTWALVAILLSGIYTSWHELDGSLSGLWSSGWGRVLLTKIAFVSVALTLGAITRLKCVQRPATSERADLMARLLWAEALLMIVILCLSGLLANTAPAVMEMGFHFDFSSLNA
jgi:putative copper resistance protein D